jgi:hypothetical protein
MSGHSFSGFIKNENFGLEDLLDIKVSILVLKLGTKKC